MQIKTEYRKNGLIFSISEGRKAIRFPLDKLDKKLVQDESWNTLNILEQVWYQGLLRYENGQFLLVPEDFYELDEETVAELPITHYTPQIELEESGNVGRSDYRIHWHIIIRGRNAGRCQRLGCIVQAGGFDFLLNQAQYNLIRELENAETLSSTEERARFQAKCKFLAKKAGAKLSTFMEERDFHFCDRTEIGIVSENDQEIQLVPELAGLPEELQEQMPKQLRGVAQFQQGGRRTRVFTSPDAERQYNTIGRIPPIKGKQVPQFLENPLAFIPEEVEFDADVFSKRVKGLKIRTAKAVPYLHIEQDKEHSGWFDVDTGITIQGSGEDPVERTVQDSPQLQQLMEDAIEAGEEYLYYDNQWIKLNPEECKEYRNAKRQMGSQKHVSQAQARQILDIYENIDGIEYNETSLYLKHLMQEMSNRSSTVRAFQGTLKDYQETGYLFLKSHYDTKTGVLLADDMGLGKTVQVIALLAYLYDQNELAPALLVMPNSLIENWTSELGKFLPSARALYVHQGANRYRKADMIRKYDVVLTTYETLARDQAFMGTIRWSCVICDEVQKIKNFHTLASGAVKGMNTSCRIALTGTPVENRLSELWSIADFAQPGLLSSYQSFRKHYEKPIQSGGIDRQRLSTELIEALSPIFLRRTKEEVLGSAIPPKQEQHIDLPMTPEQERLYLQLVNEVQNSDENIALGTIQKLIMLCSHPRLVTKKLNDARVRTLKAEAPKLAWTMEKLKEIKRRKEKVIIFTGYKMMQSILRQTIYEEFHLDTRIINGEVKGNRLDVIREFSQMPGFNVMILSPKAAGVGLNIVAANHVIHYTREWNPAIENQATDRAYRIGQTKPVTVYYPVMKSRRFTSAEERLDELLTQKRALMSSVIVPTDLGIKWQDFRDILK